MRMKILVGLVLALVLAVLLGSLWLASFALTGKRQTLDEALTWQSEHYDTSFYDALEKTDYTVAGYEGYLLHVQKLSCPQPSTRYVILSHGYTDNRMGSLKYVPMYLDLGYHCIIYDLRGHGLNEPTFSTYGLFEGRDLALLVEDTRARYQGLTQLVLHGESMGSATTISSLASHPDIDFVVADCGFADIDNVLRRGYRDAGAPAFLVDFADFGARLRYHVSLKEMRPIDALDDNHVPVLFIHGADDALIIPQNSRDMYERTRGKREIYLVEGAGHAESVLVDPESYQAQVEAFLARL